MREHVKYSLEQFKNAANDLMPAVAKAGMIPGELHLCMGSDGWALEPYFSARKILGDGSCIHLWTQMQDDGGDPYIVVEVERSFSPGRPGRHGRKVSNDWHAASFDLGFKRLYPHQHSRIPEIVAFLESRTLPTEFPDLTRDEN